MGVAALVADRDQLLGDQLLEPFAVCPVRQVDHASRIGDAQCTIFITGPLDPQIAICLCLEGGGGHRPEPRAAFELATIYGGIDKGWPRHWRCPVEPFQALHGCYLCDALLARPSVNGSGFIAGIDGQFGQRHHRAMLMHPSLAKKRCQLVPARRIVRAARNDDVIDEPALQPATPSPDIDLDAVFLHVRTGSQEQPACGDLRREGNPPVGQTLPFRGFAAFNPCLTQQRVARGAQHLVGALGSQPVPCDLFPAFPADRRIEGREVEPDGMWVV